MSDTPQGPGWWQASDGKWYPPQEPPTEPTPTTQPIPPVPPPGPPGPPTASFGPTPPGPGQPPPGSGGGNRTPLLIGLGVLVAALAVIAFLVTRGDDDEEATDAGDRTEQTEASDESDRTDESDESDQTDESDNTDESDTDDSDVPDDVDLESLLLTPEEVGPEFNETTLPPSDDVSLCGTPSFRSTTDPVDQAGIAVESAGGSVGGLEELYLYETEAEARDAYDAAVEGVSCDEGTLDDGTKVDVEGLDVTDRVGADEAWGLELSGTDFDVNGMVARVGRILIVLQAAEDSTASGTLVDIEDLAKKAVGKVKEG